MNLFQFTSEQEKSLDQLVVRGTHKQKVKNMYILFFFSSLKPKLPPETRPKLVPANKMHIFG